MFESIMVFFRKITKKDKQVSNSKDAAKERLHLVLMQDRANVSADFLELMKQEIIDVIKKYIDVDETAMDVRLTNKTGEDGTNGAPALYANIPILHIKNEEKSLDEKDDKKLENEEIKKEPKEEIKDKKEEVKEKVVNQELEKKIENKDKIEKKVKSVGNLGKGK